MIDIILHEKSPRNLYNIVYICEKRTIFFQKVENLHLQHGKYWRELCKTQCLKDKT